MLNQLFIHLIIILFPIFIQQFFFSRKKSDSLRYQALSGIMFGTAAIICMALPVYVIGGFQLDLRNIPLIIAIVYSGGKPLPGIIAAALAVAFRIYIGGDALLEGMLGILLCNVPSFLFVKAFPKYSSFKRIIVSIGLCVASLAVSLGLLYFYLSIHRLSLDDRPDDVYLFMMTSLVSLSGMAISSLLKEHMIESAMLKQELERSEKLKIVSQIAASVAHEVRNPLTVVKGFLQLLKETVDDKKREYLNIALSELDRAEFIITDYLNLAKPQADQLELIEVSAFLHGTIEIMNSYSLIQNVQIQLNCNQTDLFVLADKPKLTQVMLNLIKNGVEAIPKTGEVTVNAYFRNDYIYIDIIDTGIGMTKDELEQIGTAFYTTKSTGTGLGLLVTTRIIEAMRGKLSFESESGKGTKVKIRLPAYQLRK